MNTLSEQEIIHRIKRQEPFAAVIDSGAFSIKIDRYIPAISTAIHAGHTVQKQILDKLLLTEKERKYEEDPYTGDMLASLPIVLQGLNSRYQYDLNRASDKCIYEEAWGKKVWSVPLTTEERNNSLKLYDSYYRVLHALLTTLEKKYSNCIVYDLHSYNYRRLKADAPLFNIGTHYIDKTVYQPVLDDLRTRLIAAELPGIEKRVAFDEVFMGKGFQSRFIHENHGKCLCIPLEIKKVYMAESSGEPYPETIAAFTNALRQALSCNAGQFCRFFINKKIQDKDYFSEVTPLSAQQNQLT